MEQPVHPETAPTSNPDGDALPAYVLSREYEDYLDWQENQRRSRTGGGLRRLLGAVSVVATAFSLAGVVFRRR